jgi:hypothetical protein
LGSLRRSLGTAWKLKCWMILRSTRPSTWARLDAKGGSTRLCTVRRCGVVGASHHLSWYPRIRNHRCRCRRGLGASNSSGRTMSSSSSERSGRGCVIMRQGTLLGVADSVTMVSSGARATSRTGTEVRQNHLRANSTWVATAGVAACLALNPDSVAQKLTGSLGGEACQL